MLTVFGIDLGTTNSAIAYLDEGGDPEVVPNNVTGHLTTPSVVYFQEPTEVVVGDVARNAAIAEPENVISLVKRSMGETRTFKIHNIEHTPESISALILKHLHEDATEKLGSPGNGVVITVPAYFGMRETQATIEAGALAGLNVISTIPEPIAAALHYGLRPGNSTETLMVFDLGGGTFDTSVLKIGSDAIDTIVIDGDRNLGGADWDSRISEWLISEFTRRTDCDPAELDDPGFAQLVLQQAESAKIQLSQVQITKIPIRYGARAATIELSRERYEALTEELLERTIRIVRRTLKTAASKSVRAGAIADVLLVGGATLMPSVQRRLAEEFGWTGRRVDPHLAVVKGAAIYAEGIRADSTDSAIHHLPRVQKVLPRSFGVRLDRERSPYRQDLYIEYLADANDPLPILGRKLTVMTKGDGVETLSLPLYEQNGEKPSPIIALNRELTPEGGFVFRGLPRLPKGSPVTIVVDVGEDGLATVEAYEAKSGQRLTTNVQLGVLQAPQLRELERAVGEIDLLH
jgi:molecular chaperone DnaK